MRLITTITTGLFCCCPLLADDASESIDPIDAAIEAFHNRDRSQDDEALALSRETPATNPQDKPEEPVLVTGKKPTEDGRVDISEIPVDPDAAVELPPAQPEAKGLKVRVERLQTGKGDFKPESVRLLAPFPAKPLDEAPAGWLLESSNAAPAIQRQVELAPGKAITLTIKPHVLVPDADNERILAVAEPGFEASLGYQQSDTISAVLSDSIEKLDEDSRRIGNAIDQLQQLIVSLPKPEKATNPETNPDSASSIPDAGTPIPE